MNNKSCKFTIKFNAKKLWRTTRNYRSVFQIYFMIYLRARNFIVTPITRVTLIVWRKKSFARLVDGARFTCSLRKSQSPIPRRQRERSCSRLKVVSQIRTIRTSISCWPWLLDGLLTADILCTWTPGRDAAASVSGTVYLIKQYQFLWHIRLVST